jgi:hypothetical protein
MKRFGQLAQWLALVSSIVFWSMAAHAQFTEGSIVGSVTDSSGAAIAGAAVQITNVQTATTTDVRS